MVLNSLRLFLLLFFVKNVFLDSGTEDISTIQTSDLENFINETVSVRIEIPLEMRAAFSALEESINYLKDTQQEIIGNLKSILEDKLKNFDLELKNQLLKTKEEVISETNQNVKHQLTDVKNEVIAQKKQITEMESIIQTQFHGMKDLRNEIIKSTQDIVNESGQTVRQQLTEIKNEMVVEMNSLKESTQVAISESDNLTSEIQSSINSQFEEMETKLNMVNELNDIKNQLMSINETEQGVKNQVTKSENEIIVKMDELKDSRLTDCYNVKESLTEAKDEMIDQMKTLFFESENRIEGMQSEMQTQFKEIKDAVYLSEDFNKMKYQLSKTKEEILTEIQECKIIPRDCKEVMSRGYKASGIYRIQPMLSMQGFLVWCDMKTRGGGWTYVVNRFDGSQNFSRNWADYKQGFGNLSGEYWLGLDRLHDLTNSKRTELLFELIDWNSKKVYALYDNFQVGDEFESYTIKNVGNYKGDAGDSFKYHSSEFSTPDKDHTQKECAKSFDAGWWYKHTNCYDSCLTGGYVHSKNASNVHSAIQWQTFHGFESSLKEARMMIRPLHR